MINSNYSNTPSFTGMFKILSSAKPEKFDLLREDILKYRTKANFSHVEDTTIRIDVPNDKKSKSLLNLLIRSNRIFSYCNDNRFSKLKGSEKNIELFDKHF